MTTNNIVSVARLSIAEWNCVKTPILRENLEDSKSTSGGTLCVFGSHTFVPKSWMCKKQTTVSHSFTESDIISLDAGLRMDGLPALDLWDVVIEVLRSSNSTKTPTNHQQETVRGITNPNPN